MRELKAGTLIRSEWAVVKTIAAGSFGQVYEARRRSDGRTAAVKVELKTEGGEALLILEVGVARKFSGQPHAPDFLSSGTELGPTSFLWMAMELLGPTLTELKRRCRAFSGSTGLRLFRQGLEALEQFHTSTGFVHRDLKPSNLAMGLDGGPKSRTLILLDFGLARRLLTLDWRRVRRARSSVAFRGSLRYASAAAHFGRELGRADDVWSLLYVVVELMGGRGLGWVGEQGLELIGRMKQSTTADELLAGLPQAAALAAIPAYLGSLQYESRPDYGRLDAVLGTALDALGAAPDDEWDWERSLLSSLRRSLSSLRHPSASSPNDPSPK